MYKFLIKFALLIFCLVIASGKTETLKFSQLDVRDGLPDNSVREIVQDKYGFIWFGTELGLARYDGISIKQYLADNNKANTIADSYVRSIDIDNNNNMWISSGRNGLSRYNRDTDDFTVFKHQEDDPNSLSSNSIMSVYYSDDNDIWIATAKGVDRLNIVTESFERFTHYESKNSEPISIENSNIRSLIKTKDNTLWLGGNKGLAYFDKSSNKFQLASLRTEKQPEILSIAIKSDNEFWLGTKEGLLIYNRRNHELRKFDLGEDVRQVHSVLIDNEQNSWVGTARFGLFRIDGKGRILHMQPDKSDKNAITDVSILDIMQDHSGMIWVATYRTGVNFFNPNSLKFGSHDNSLNSLNCLESIDIRSAQALSNEIVLLGTTKGLEKVDLIAKKCLDTHIPEELKSRLSDTGVYAIHLDPKGNQWFGTHTGLLKFDPDANKLVQQLDKVKINKRVGVYGITPYRDQLFLATNTGVFLFEPSTNTLEKMKNASGESDIGYVYSIVVDSNGGVWCATVNGLFKLNKELNTLQPVAKGKSPLIGNGIWGMAIDDKDNLWLAIAGQGLFKYTASDNRLVAIGEDIGITIKDGFGELNLVDKNFWLTTFNSGIYKINKESLDVTNYTSADGLHSELFNRNAFTQFDNGNLLFGGKTGFNLFSPSEIKENDLPPIISLTQLKRFGKEVIPHINHDGLLIDNHISDIAKISLSHKDTIFGFEFIATDYFRPEKITYSYILENFDQNWTETSAQNRGVTYNNVNPGNYVFRVRAKNSRSIWSENDVALNITIAPAPWLTWWAYTIYTITALFLLWFSLNKRTQWLKNRAVELEKTVNVRTKELATEKEKVEQLLSRKNEEFANVSHEFRTPLTLILGPINQLVTKSKDKNLVGKLNIVQRNALRLLRMVDQLLNLETFRVKAITQKSPQAIGKITQLVAEAFADLAEEKQITFNVETIEPVCFDFTPDAFEKIILNLLSNAIKYTKPGGAISISATRYENNRYQIQVSDTGIGIAKDKLDKVFERFNRVMDENSEQVTGSGIGLALVKSLVESHDGSVELESELGQGTTITVTLPIVNEVDESQINVHQNDEIIAMELMNVSSSGLHESSKAQSAETIQSTGKPTVLVIEDNDDMRQYIVESIGQQFNTLVAADGQAGLESAIQEVPDLIISDIMMPKLDGYQTTKALREAQITNHIPVVLLTARGDRDSRLKGWEEKADEYITKPFDVEELIIRISNLIEIRNILKRRFSETVFEQTEQPPKSLVQEMDSDSESLSIVEINTQKLQQEFINQLNQQIESVYMNAELGVIDLAKSVNMSERQFYRKLKSVIDMTPSEYLRRFRLEKSKEVLRSGKTANFTAFEVGFSSQAYFSKCFKAQYNLTPKQFVNQK